MSGRDLRLLGLWVVVLALLASPVAASWSNPFDSFFHDYNKGLLEIIDKNCSDEYKWYREDKHNATGVSPALEVFGMGSMTHELIECMLRNVPELAKTKMSAAAIVLGLSPSIVATLGIRPQDTAVLSIVGHRHVLAFAVAVGSPALNAYRASEYQSVIDSLRDNTMGRPQVMKRFDTAIIAVEYALAAASIANIGELTYRLGARMIFTVTPTRGYIILIWAFLGVVIHIMAGLTMFFRVSSHIQKPKEEVPTSRSWLVSVAKSEVDILTRRSKIIFSVHPESLIFSVLSLLTTVVTACHIIFGTLVFSSVIFLSVNDSLYIIARMMAGTILTRIIVTFELLVLRETVEEEENFANKHVLSFKRSATTRIPSAPH